MIKIEINSYDVSALKHLGAALTAMAADLGADHEKDRDCGCTVDSSAPWAPQDIKSVHGMNESLPADTATMVNVAPAPPAPVDDDANWPDPPQSEQVATGHIDGEGIPWDARIHAGTKTRIKANNTWKLKPGIDMALVEQVKAELKGVQSAVAVPPAPAPVAAPPTPSLADAAAVSAMLQAPSAPPAPAPAPAAPANFAEFIKEVTGRITSGQMTPDNVNGAVATATGGQLTMCNQLAARQDLIPAVWSVLCPTVG